jgi:hypothetical protein
MIFNVVNGGQIYDNGDSIDYPVANIPQGAEKVYTEQYISDIGSGLNDILYPESTSPRYTTEDMSDALATILSFIKDCSDAVNDKSGTTGDIILSNLATAIREIPQGGSGIGTEWEYITSTYTVNS